MFNWDQTEVMPKKDAGPALNPDRDLIEVCNSILDRMQNPPAYRESGSAAYYVPKEDLVNLSPIEMFKTTEGYVAARFHEYGHATGHESRLSRPGIMAVAAFGGEDYSFEELVAELASAYHYTKNGINNTLENSSAYIRHWLKALRDDKTMLMKPVEKQWQRWSTSLPGEA